MAPNTPTNDTQQLTPTLTPVERELTFDFPSFRVGVAEYAAGPTGCTLFLFPQMAQVSCDIRGGLPGTIMAGDGPTDAICFAGGSLLGLAAATGVASELFAQKQYSLDDMPVVRGAIIFDFARPNTIYPDHALGRAAVQAARLNWFPLGRHGAACSANVGQGLDWSGGESSGQGGAFAQFGPTKIAVFAAVNAIGAIVNRDGMVVRGHLDRATGERHPMSVQLDQMLAQQETDKPTRNTTLTIVITNQKLEPRQLTQLGRQVHSSLARAIQPFHTGYDGDTLFAVTTAEVENKALTTPSLGVLASELAWDAVLRCFDPEELEGTNMY